MKKDYFDYARSIIEKHEKVLAEGANERELLSQTQEAEDNPLLKSNPINTNIRWKPINLEKMSEQRKEL